FCAHIFESLVSFDVYFILDRFTEFGVDGGSAAKALEPKFDISMKHVSSHFGFSAPHVEMRHIVAASIFLQGLGGLLFIFSSSFGACLLPLSLALTTLVIHDYYENDIEMPEFMQFFSKFIQNLALFGTLIFSLGMKNSNPNRQKKRVTKSKTN
ncbi:uncharacterized protein LOC141823857, partial [Curcuma longa]|uniref:uncharacterized protein LOC141823857 n=1 Tax=Curcuma longa TaxID=136217 RepID=UPI003D9DB50E